MKINFKEIEHLPKLSWLLSADFRANKGKIRHGSWVETSNNFAVEGVWSEAFEEGNMQDSDSFFGSAVVIDEGEVILVPSITTVDYIYYRFSNSILTASNSLPLLLAAINDKLDPHFTTYADINNSIMDGIEDYQRNLPSRTGEVRRLIYNNLKVTKQGYQEKSKKNSKPFKTYHEYINFMQQRINGCFSNAQSSKRNRKFSIFSTQSTGYDSTFINCIASKYGVDKVFSSPDSKESGAFYFKNKQIETFSDDGKPICDLLGLPCEHIDRRAFENDVQYELLFYAGIHENTDFNLQQIFNQIKQPTLLLTGVLGELWYTLSATPKNKIDTINDKLERWDLGLHGLSEIRLHTGFIHFPAPYIGARYRKNIMDITESEEMLPWRIGGNYDRPIARRMAEERGIPRQMFGQNKLASIVHFPTPTFPFDTKLLHDYKDFLVENQLLSKFLLFLIPLVHKINNWIYWNNPQKYFYDYKKYPLGYYLNRIYTKITGDKLKFKRIWQHIDGSLFCFSCNRVAESYKKTLANFHCYDET